MSAPTTADVYAVLQSIDTTLKHLLGLAEARNQRATAGTSIPRASDADLDSQYGDPTITTKDPRDWSGSTMKGKRFSECPAEYLDLLADRFNYFADNQENDAEGKKKRAYNLKDAARARGWAARLRAGWKPPAAPTQAPAGNPFGGSDDSDVRF